MQNKLVVVCCIVPVYWQLKEKTTQQTRLIPPIINYRMTKDFHGGFWHNTYITDLVGRKD